MAGSLDDEDHRTLQNKCDCRYSSHLKCSSAMFKLGSHSICAPHRPSPHGPFCVPRKLPLVVFHLPKKQIIQNFSQDAKRKRREKTTVFRSVHRKFPSLIELVTQSLSPRGGERLGDGAKKSDFQKEVPNQNFQFLFSWVNGL